MVVHFIWVCIYARIITSYGNLGFNIPGDWCFDQFCTDITIGSGNGTVRIDKVGVSGKDIGISKVVLPGINKFYNYLTSIYDLFTIIVIIFQKVIL